MNEPATDLAVVCAIASSYFEQPIARDVALVGEVGLGSCAMLGTVLAPSLTPGLPTIWSCWCFRVVWVCAMQGHWGRVGTAALLPSLGSLLTSAAAAAAAGRAQVGLGGELRPVGNIERRIAEAAKVSRGAGRALYCGHGTACWRPGCLHSPTTSHAPRSRSWASRRLSSPPLPTCTPRLA